LSGVLQVVAEVGVVSGPEPFKLVKAPVSLVLMLGAITALPPMAIDMYLPSLPAISAGFGAPAGAAQATLATFFAGLAIGQFFHGPASDRCQTWLSPYNRSPSGPSARPCSAIRSSSCCFSSPGSASSACRVASCGSVASHFVKFCKIIDRYLEKSGVTL